MIDADVRQPLVSLTTTEYVPSAVTMMLCVVSPVDQVYDANPGEAVSVVESPLQIRVLPVMSTWIESQGSGLQVMPKDMET